MIKVEKEMKISMKPMVLMLNLKIPVMKTKVMRMKYEKMKMMNNLKVKKLK
jgi:hypothetical protein